MAEAFLHFLKSQAYLMMFVAVFCDQGALSVPSQPFLVGMGVLIAAGTHSLLLALPLAALAALLADLAWYGAGRTWGWKAFRRLTRWRPRLGAQATRVEKFVVRRNVGSFLLAKFGPAPSFLAPFLAGTGRLSMRSFLAADIAVCAFWSFAYIALGYLGMKVSANVIEYAAPVAVLVGAGTVLFVWWMRKFAAEKS